MIGQLWQFTKNLRQSFGFARADSYKHVQRVKPSYTVGFGVLGIDILTRETVFQELSGLRHYTKCSQALSFSLPTFFSPLLARFFRSTTPVTKSLARANTRAQLWAPEWYKNNFCACTSRYVWFTFRLCQPLLLAYSWAMFGSKLFRIHATILTLRNEIIVSIRESNAVSLEKIIWKSLSDHWSNSIRGTEKKRVSVGVNVHKWLHVFYVSPYIVLSPLRFLPGRLVSSSKDL